MHILHSQVLLGGHYICYVYETAIHKMVFCSVSVLFCTFIVGRDVIDCIRSLQSTTAAAAAARLITQSQVAILEVSFPALYSSIIQFLSVSLRIITVEQQYFF